MAIVLDGTAGITTPDVDSGPVSGTTANFSGNVTLGSSVLATPSGSAPSYTCRAWVNFNGTGTVAIRASGNVSSITDSGTGNYTVNFTTALPDANYGVSLSTNASGSEVVGTSTKSSGFHTISSVIVFNGNTSGVLFDPLYVNVAIFR